MNIQAKTYYCLGCNKEIHSRKDYPDGWICLKCRDKVGLIIKCSVCGNPFQVKWDTYRMKNPSIPWRCRRCNDDYRNALYDAKPEEEKKAFVEKQIKNIKKYYNNMTDDERKQNTENRKRGWDKRRVDGTAEHCLKSMKEGRTKWWDSLSDEQKRKQWDYLNDGRDKWWKSLSDDEKKIHMQIAWIGHDEWYSSLTPEQKIHHFKAMREANKNFWQDILHDRDKYYNWRVKFIEGYKNYKDKVNPHSCYVEPSKNELALINEFNKYKIDFIFQYPSSKIHPDFSKLYPYNKVTGADLVDPTHMWDFLVKTKSGNIFVDIDGSIHFKETYTTIHDYTKKEYSILEYNKFNDSQRPYQTDGLPAYAILCYDDNLNDNTPVININTNEKMTFKSFMVLLSFLDNPESNAYNLKPND